MIEKITKKKKEEENFLLNERVYFIMKEKTSMTVSDGQDNTKNV